MFEPIPSQNISTNVMRQVRDAIAAGTFMPGDRLPSERELATTFAVSRSTVRQAISALEALHIVEIRHGDGVYVAVSDASHAEGTNRAPDSATRIPFDDIIEAREVIECSMVAICALRRDPKIVERLRRLVAQQRGADEAGSDEAAAVNRAFHRTIAEGTGNPSMVKTMDLILHMMQYSVGPSATDAPSSAESSVGRNEHERIVDAIAEGRPEAASEEMRKHLSAIRGSGTAGRVGRNTSTTPTIAGTSPAVGMTGTVVPRITFKETQPKRDEEQNE